MVKPTATTLLSLFSFITVGLSAPSCSSNHVQRSADTIAQIKTDLTLITNGLGVLSTDIDKFPTDGTQTLLDAFAINSQALSLCSVLGKATSAVQANGKILETDGRDIVATLGSLPTAVNHTLSVLISKKPTLESFTVGNVRGLIEGVLIFLKGNTTAYGNSMINFNADSLTVVTTKIRDTCLTSFDQAITAFST